MSAPAYSPRPGFTTAEMLNRTAPSGAIRVEGRLTPERERALRWAWEQAMREARPFVDPAVLPVPSPSGWCADTVVAWAVLAVLYALAVAAVLR